MDGWISFNKTQAAAVKLGVRALLVERGGSDSCQTPAELQDSERMNNTFGGI